MQYRSERQQQAEGCIKKGEGVGLPGPASLLPPPYQKYGLEFSPCRVRFKVLVQDTSGNISGRAIVLHCGEVIQDLSEQ